MLSSTPRIRRIFSCSLALSLASAGLAVLLAVSWTPSRALAQEADPEAVRAVRELDRCVTAGQQDLARIAQLIRDAEERSRSSDAALARDARAAIVTLLGRARAARETLLRCVEGQRIPDGDAPRTEVVTEAPQAGSAEARVAVAGGTVREVHPAEPLAEGVRVVRGERVDGRGVTPPDALQRAVRGQGAALARCYEAFVDRGSARRGELELSFAVVGGVSREARVESAPGFDATFRGCVTQAVGAMSVPGSSGRSVFSYVFAFGAP